MEISTEKKIEYMLKQLPYSTRSKFRQVLQALFALPRSGWKDREVKNPETVGEHTYEMFMIAEALWGAYIPNILTIVVLHDAPESKPEIGDPRTDPLCPAEKRWTLDAKRMAEDAAMLEICTDLGEDGTFLFDLFLEYQGQETHRAQLVKQLDKTQMLIMATHYQRCGQPVNASEFLTTSEAFVTDRILKTMISEAKSGLKN
jgi:5'-deoxynucleotidase YfbR-like HD superfamily hydrolase